MEAPLKDCTTLEQRSVIHLLNSEGIQTSQICQRMKNIYDSPDLAPSDYFLFGLLKKELKGKRFDSYEDVQKVVQDFFHTLPKSAYKEGIYKLPERRRRCIESQGMAIHPDGTRTYRTCNNCYGVELTPTHIFSCPAMAAASQKIDMDPDQQLYTPKIVDIATSVIEMHGDI
ncbi:hypothetical protein LAZ67_17001361 [Cordylochernes scorpioides]|uniref:Uncharacterized protein n=1 Tax=Cordylochernes scorpioides TaxID=51811 RepID=A0ABY6LDG5_9ARAC|nr:hypothetical protein LAZ67_17001361 [Cordylochernes scorpioides]